MLYYSIFWKSVKIWTPKHVYSFDKWSIIEIKKIEGIIISWGRCINGYGFVIKLLDLIRW